MCFQGASNHEKASVHAKAPTHATETHLALYVLPSCGTHNLSRGNKNFAAVAATLVQEPQEPKYLPILRSRFLESFV